MAAIDLKGANSIPWCYTNASIGTTWQEYELPLWCTAVLVNPITTDCYVAFDSNGVVASAESPSDGGAVGTHRAVVAGDGAIVFTRPSVDKKKSASIFVASSSGTITVNLTLLGD